LNLKEELIKYCEKNVKTLYQVIDAFSKQIFNLFRIDILKYPTLSSLAFAIYRSNFLKDDVKIPLISREMFNLFKKGYTGGALDVFKPNGENIFRYDVNSLYPHVMKECSMPVGNPIFFEGDITKIDKDAFGLFKVDVETPKNLNIPVLQCKIKTVHGENKTIAPLGTWRGMTHSNEINAYKKYGYKFKIYCGYIFEQSHIFKEYVESLYELKLNSEKGSPDYIISKLLMNSLYGRFGMSPIMEQHIIINDKDLTNFFS